jgi:deoxyribonuclease-1-like protein
MVAHPRRPSRRRTASRRLITAALAFCAIGAARAGDLVPIRIPGAAAVPAADMPPLVPIVRTPPAPVAIRTLPIAPVAVQRPVLALPLPPPLPPITVPPPAIVAPPVATAPPVPVAPPALVAPPLAAPPPILQPPPVAIAPPPPAPAALAPPPSGKPNDAVLIASFNIQVFGESKLAKPQVVDVLTRVVRRFDIVAVQEVRAKSDSIVPTFVAAINADGSRYQYVIGPRLGRTSSKEQYTFIYDSTRIEIDPSSVATLPNPGDKLHRPPLRARFRVRANPPEAGFSFWLVDIHTDPDEVPQEVDALADAFVSMRSVIPDEDDVILLGDLNAGPPQFGRIKQIPGIGWAVSGATTNTRRSKTYDNLIFDRTATTEYTGRWGVLDLQQTFGLPLDKALEVSDHNPVWAAFSPWETQRIAGR